MAELRKSLQSAVREHNRIRGQIGSCGREIRMNELTESELKETEPSVPLYRSVGKMFSLTSNPDMLQLLEQEREGLQTRLQSLKTKEEFLERRIKSEQDSLSHILTAR